MPSEAHILRRARQLLYMAWFRRHAAFTSPAGSFPFELPLCPFSDKDMWCLRDACEGVQIFGSPGSGKTSSSGQMIAKAFLRNGFGGLVLTAKPDEADLWRSYCQATGRQDDLQIFGIDRAPRFNFLEYELHRKNTGAGLTENLASLFCNVLEVAGQSSRDKSGSTAYFDRAVRQLLRNAIDLLVIATGHVSLPDITKVITSAPTTIDHPRDREWREASECWTLLQTAQERSKSPRQTADLELTMEFFLGEFPKMDERTRSNIISTFTTMADGLLRGPIRELFCTDLTIQPEDTHDGAIILLDLPVTQYHDVGRIAQVLFKYCWQRATGGRTTTSSSRPVFLFADEAHYFVTSHDVEFLTTARSARACTAFITQALSNYDHAFGHGNDAPATQSLLATLQTQIFHANGDVRTNEYAERFFAKRWGHRSNSSSSSPQDQTNGRSASSSTTSGMSESVEPEVLASEFVRLRKGGDPSGHWPQAYVGQTGRIWRQSNRTSLKTNIPQHQP